MKNQFTGTLCILRFIWRKERFISAVWLLILVSVTAGVAAAFEGLFPAEEDILSVAFLFSTPAMVAMMGPLFGEVATFGTLFSASMMLFTMIAAALMNVFFAVRNTRGEEEKGREELLRSLPAGRLTSLGAAMLYSLMQNLALALFIGITLPLLGVESIGWGGSMLYGFCIGGTGMLFAALAAVFSQLSSNSRGATGLSLAALGLFYIMRAAGDIGGGALSFISPLGLALRAECYSGNFWWPVLVLLVLCAAFSALAFYFNFIRDAEQGLIPQKSGRREASKFLLSHGGLAFRLLQNSLIAWAVGLFLFGAAYGSVMGDMESFIEGNEILKNIMIPPEGHTATEMFITMIISLLAIVAALPAAGAMLKLGAEEKQRRYESVFSKAVPRGRIFADYLFISLAAGAAMLIIAMTGLWVAAAFVMEGAISLGSAFSAFIVYLPAVWTVTGIAAFLTAAIPEKASVCVNGYLGFSFLVIYLGEMLSFPEFVKYFTPYGYIPKLPIDSFNIWVALLLTTLAAALITGGICLYRRRDLR